MKAGTFESKPSVFPEVAQIGEVHGDWVVVIEFVGQDPADKSAAGFDLDPPFTDSVFDYVDFASALAEAHGETALASFRNRFGPHREPDSLRPENKDPAAF